MVCARGVSVWFSMHVCTSVRGYISCSMCTHVYMCGSVVCVCVCGLVLRVYVCMCDSMSVHMWVCGM